MLACTPEDLKPRPNLTVCTDLHTHMRAQKHTHTHACMHDPTEPRPTVRPCQHTQVILQADTYAELSDVVRLEVFS